ncbi:MAG: hypothetical protein C5B53_11645 [Candidatus Melainabacteria bacterium]|nr:MAG: hypothetical protein C5B53_11645 [Candidatus Melainabacteria bacterium]
MNEGPLSFEPGSEPIVWNGQQKSITDFKGTGELFRLLVASVKDYAIYMIDPEGIVVTWNEGAKRIKGYSAREIIGKHFSIFYPTDKRKAGHPTKELEIALRQGRYEEESWRVRKDGSTFWARVVITAIHDHDGQHIGFAKVTQDLSERRQREQERELMAQTLASSNEELQQVAYRISHELQPPLATILSYCKLLSVRYQDRLGADANEFLSKMRDASALIKRMIDDLWTYARVSKIGQPTESVDMERALTDAKTELKDIIESETIKSSELPKVQGNQKQLTFLLKELIQNAIRYKGLMPARIEIVATEADGGWLFSVKDNGRGIDKVAASDIFKVFHRAKNGSESSSTGMGLAICRRILEQHRGRIWFESQPGRSSTFFFWLPGDR